MVALSSCIFNHLNLITSSWFAFTIKDMLISLFRMIPLSQCICAAVTKIISVGGLETAEIFPTVMEAGKSKTKEIASLVS